MLDVRDAQLDAEENACVQKAIRRHVHELLKCVGFIPFASDPRFPIPVRTGTDKGNLTV